MSKFIMEKLAYVPVILLFVNFLISGLLINGVQLILWLCLRPLSIRLYRKLNYYCLYCLWIQIVFIAEWWSSSTCSVVTDDETWAKMGHEHAIIVMNHSFEVDWLMGWLVCEQARLIASSKVFIKKSIKWVPLLGWGWQFAEAVFLERNWEKDKLAMEKQVVNLASYPDPVWLLLFAEGTRYTKVKHAASIEFAKKSGLKPLKHLLLPRTKGFVLTAEQLREKFPAIYSATLSFNTKEGAQPTLKNMLLGRRVIGEMVIERIPLDVVPEDPEKASEWLHTLYQHKDDLLDTYQREGMFPSSITNRTHYFNGPIRSHYRPRRLWSVLVVTVSSFITLPPVFSLLNAMLSAGIHSVFLAIILLLSAMVALYKLVALTRVSKGSAYGKSPVKKNTSKSC